MKKNTTTSKALKKKSQPPPQARNPWEQAKARALVRQSPCGCYNEEIDRGVNFFVLMLEQLGAETHYSCEGHPGGFYVLFYAPYKLAKKIWEAGYFTVEIEGNNLWSIRKDFADIANKNIALELAAISWETNFGTLKTTNPGRGNRRRNGAKGRKHMARRRR